MIFYFSGTGNSLQVAKIISVYQDEDVVSIASLMSREENLYEFTLKPDEKIGFVFPVYAWAPPRIVMDFIQNLKINNLNNTYIFSVATCGENIGNTMEILDKYLKKQNMYLDSGFSVVMPSNYMMIGMDVDSEQVSEKKLLKVEDVMMRINKVIGNEEKGLFLTEKGNMPGVFTTLIGSLFSKYPMNTKKFYAKDNCISCGICESVCNTKTIKVIGKPTWGGKCTQCLACLNLCPVKAIEYGKATLNRGRYHNPYIKVEELGK